MAWHTGKDRGFHDWPSPSSTPSIKQAGVNIKHSRPILFRHGRWACTCTYIEQLVQAPLLALQGRSAFRMIRHSCLCLDKGAQGIAYLYAPLQRTSPPQVFHMCLSVPTVACQDLPVLAFSPYTQPRRSESWRGAPSLMWLAGRSASVMYQTRGQSCQGKHAFPGRQQRPGLVICPGEPGGPSTGFADLYLTAHSHRENVPQAYPDRGFRTNVYGAGSLIESGSKICYYT